MEIPLILWAALADPTHPHRKGKSGVRPDELRPDENGPGVSAIELASTSAPLPT
jgi:hypothetical protein